MTSSRQSSAGFTLVELAIVLVIIGLLVGGVLVGQDLIRSAAMNAAVRQIQQFDAGVETFRDKYGGLPGDLTPTRASQAGLATRSGSAWQGDGNGLIETVQAGIVTPTGTVPDNLAAGQGGGETGLFWVDLATAGFVPGTFIATYNSAGPITITNLPSYLPSSKIGQNNYVFVYAYNGRNFYGMAAPSGASTTAIDGGNQLATAAGLSAVQALNIDRKTDDGVPLTGATTATTIGTTTVSGKTGSTTTSGLVPSSNAAPAVSGNCFDSTTTAGVYAPNVSGDNLVCTLSMRLQ